MRDMRPSPLKHTLAVLRHTIGPDMTQKEMARLLNRSPVTIQKIELGLLPLSEDLASSVHWQTGVSIPWLLKNDVTAPIITQDGAPYTRQIFEVMQSLRPNNPALLWANYCELPQAMAYAIINIARGGIASMHSKEVGAVALYNYRITHAIEQVVEKVSGFDDWCDSWIERLEKCDPNNPREYYQLIEEVLRDYTKYRNKGMEAQVGRPLPTVRQPQGSSQPSRPRRRRRAG